MPRDRWEWFKKVSAKKVCGSRAVQAKTEASARANLRTLVEEIARDGISLTDVVLLMNQATARRLAAMVNPLGQVAFPAVSAEGGSIFGIPVATSKAITAATGIVAVRLVEKMATNK